MDLRIMPGKEAIVSLVLNLPTDLENQLPSEAARLPLSLPEYAWRLLAAAFRKSL
jgi:hypothetical protein